MKCKTQSADGNQQTGSIFRSWAAVGNGHIYFLLLTPSVHLLIAWMLTWDYSTFQKVLVLKSKVNLVLMQSP